MEAMRGLHQQQVPALGKLWAGNLTIFPAQAGLATTAPLFAAHPWGVIPRIPLPPPADPGVPGWADEWHRMSLFDRSLFVLAVVTVLLTMAQVAIGAAQLLQQPPASVTTEQIRPTNQGSVQGSVEVPTTTTRLPRTTTSLPSIIGTPSTTSAARTTQTGH
jgi:hypothetical protein